MQNTDIFRAPLITPFCFPIRAFFQLLLLPAGKGRLPKYSFSDAKLPASPAGWRFWHLVSEKYTCVGIPKGINRGALYLTCFGLYLDQLTTKSQELEDLNKLKDKLYPLFLMISKAL